ncbi:MAG TPA: cupin domain-containing protein [Bacillota bacterium]|nr:cupin domain-containing protein [Bacillota bacterium]
MQEELKQIANRIKGLREIFGVTPETLAHELGIGFNLYQNYENGQEDIPVGILYKIANRFKVELASLLTGEEPRLHVYCLTRNNEGMSVERQKDYKYQSLAFNFIHKKAEPFMVVVEPEAESSPIHFNSHPGQEFDYVLEGTLKVVLDNHEVTLNAGDSLFYDSSVQHGMKALQGKPAKFLAVIM